MLYFLIIGAVLKARAATMTTPTTFQPRVRYSR
jgi:hypothetical protein